MNLQELINEVVVQTPNISGERNYWFVRTEGGDYYDEFVDNGFIALGYDQISINDIKRSIGKDDVSTILSIKEIVLKRHPTENNMEGLAARQLKNFVLDIKPDDVVLIPSRETRVLSFGYVKGGVYEAQPTADQCPYIKRWEIDWKRTEIREALDFSFYKLGYQRQAINEVRDLKSSIDRSINSYYAQEESTHLVLDLTLKEDVNAEHFFKLGMSFYEQITILNNNYNANIDVSGISVKMIVESPGKIEFKGGMKAMAMFGLLAVSLLGGEAEIGWKKINISGDGALKSLFEIYEDNEELKLKKQAMEKYMDENKIKSPDELVKIIEAIETHD